MLEVYNLLTAFTIIYVIIVRDKIKLLYLQREALSYIL